MTPSVEKPKVDRPADEKTFVVIMPNGAQVRVNAARLDTAHAKTLRFFSAKPERLIAEFQNWSGWTESSEDERW